MPAMLSFSLLGPQLRPFRNALAGLGKIGAHVHSRHEVSLLFLEYMHGVLLAS